MPVRTQTYAFARPAPYFLERGIAQTIEAQIRHGADGSLQTITSGTLTVEKPDGTNLVDAQAVTPGSSATYSLTPAATDDLGEGWTTIWVLVIDGESYTYRHSAYLGKYVPQNNIRAADVIARLPQLKARVPQNQGPRGDNVGWQPQVDAAYYEFMQELIDGGKKPWLLREASGYRTRLLIRSCQLAVQAISAGSNSSDWAEVNRQLYFEMTKAQGELKLQYDDDSPNVRRAGTSSIRLAPTGRPSW